MEVHFMFDGMSIIITYQLMNNSVRGREPQLSTQKPVFILSIQDGNNSFSGFLQELDFRPKNCILGPKKGHFCLSEPKNCLPNGRTASHQRSEGIQSYLRIWG